jgi:hypothetical protein
MLSRKKHLEDLSSNPLLNRKKNQFKSNIDYGARIDHMHCFPRQEVLEYRKNHSSKSNIEPRCTVCGLRLNEYRSQIQYETMELPAYKDGK